VFLEAGEDLSSATLSSAVRQDECARNQRERMLGWLPWTWDDISRIDDNGTVDRDR